MRKTLRLAVIALVSFVPWAHAQSMAAHGRVTVRAVVPMPEPSSSAMLAIDLFSVGVLVFLLRRRVF
jgi:hypothetical protein